MNNVIQEWIRIAEYDLETAKAMLKTKRYLYVVFMCQQAVEKILKAIYAKQKQETPPRTHNLLYLVEVLNVEIAVLDKSFLLDLNQFYISSRYPQQQRQISKTVTGKKAKIYFEQTIEVFKCLRKMLPSNK